MTPTLLVATLVFSIAFAAIAAASQPPTTRAVPVCRAGVLHVALLSRAQMCPRPLATTVIARPHPRTEHT